MTTPTFIPGIGRLAADRYLLQDHADGYALNHNAHSINLNPALVFHSSLQSNAQDAFAAIAADINVLTSANKTLTLVGDGYDTYLNSLSTPDNPYDPSVPAFDTYLNDVLNNSSNPLYYRIRSGGIVLIKTGTYKFTGTVNVPSGIILMGEGYGTKIVNQTSSPLPLFKIKADSIRVPDAGVDSTEKFIFAKETMLINLTIADNFVEPKSLGDVSYKVPKNNNSVVPLVSLEEGASLHCDNVRFMGKTVYSLGVVSNITSFAIATDSTTPVATGTRLRIVNSSIDGFAVPIKFTASGKVNDNFIVVNSLIRGYGFLNSDFVSVSNNNIFTLNASNITIANNYCFGYDITVSSLAYIIPSGSTPNLQSKNRITISNNNMCIDRSDNAIINDTTFRFVRFSGALNNSLSLLCYGNNFNNGRDFTIAIDSETPQIQITSDTFNVNTGLFFTTRTVSTTPYTIDSISKDYLLLVDTTSSAITINLPDISSSGDGRTIVIKDIGNAEANNITLVRFGGAGQIEGLSSSYTIDADFQTVQLTAKSGNWWFTGS